MTETNCNVCLTDKTLTFVSVANTTLTPKKFKIEAIDHDKLYACLDKDPSATFINNVYSTCLSPGVVPDICENATPIVGLYIQDISYGMEWKLVDANTEEVLIQEAITNIYQDEAIWNIVDTINDSDIGVFASYIYDDGSPFSIKNISDSNISLRFELYNNLSGISQYYNDSTDIEENPSFVHINNMSVEFCLTSDPNRCINSLPYTFNTESTIVKVPSDASPVLYVLDKEYGYVDTIYSNAGIMLANGERAFNVHELNLPVGLNLYVDSEISSDIDSCSLYSYQGNFYVEQVVDTWVDSSTVGAFYIEIDGVKTYLENSNRSFEHHGSSSQLKIVLAPYYQNIVSFLTSYGVDATYNPDLWGSYDTGGLNVKLTSEQIDSIKIGTQPSHELFLEGYFQGTCVQYKTFEELENSPATLTFIPATNGQEFKQSYTLLANYESSNPEETNILTLLGITEDIDMQTCFRSGGEG